MIIQLKKNTGSIVLKKDNRTIKLQQTGRRGPQGETGVSDKHFAQDFTNTASVVVAHNLGKKPAVTIMNSAGDEVIGNVNFINDNSLLVTFSSSFTGQITCN